MPFNRAALRWQFSDPVVSVTTGQASKPFQDFLNAIIPLLQSQQGILLTSMGPAGQGADDTAVFQAAVNQALKQGGATIILPAGNFSISTVTLPAGQVPITFMGMGAATVVKRRTDLVAGHGMFDVYGSNVTFDSFVIDGNVTVPVGLFYNKDFNGIGGNDPMAPSLTANTSVWVHGPCSNFLMNRITVQHTGGYAVLLDCATGGISDVVLSYPTFLNNRPHLFGFGTSQAIYGSWSGGVFCNGIGSAAQSGFVVKRFKVSYGTWLRNTGNALWGHLFSLDELNESWQFSDNYFEDQGLDAIEIGGVEGGAVSNNVFRRIGYVCVDDTSQSEPRWLQNLNATAIDSSGLVKSVLYVGNTGLSVNGGALDLDSHGLSVVNGNCFRMPYPDEPEFTTDQTAKCGLGGNGQDSYGINIGDTAKNPYGAADLNITGNTLINLRAGLVRLFAAKRCLLEANTLIAADDAIYPPVAMGPLGPEPAQRCFDNRLSHNKCAYNPSAAAPFFFEDPTYSPFQSGEANAVFGNNPITPSGTKATEFQKDPNSGSVVYQPTVWFT